MSIGARKYAGSSSFLSKFQKSTGHQAEDDDGASTPRIAPEDILEMLAESKEMAIAQLGQRFGVSTAELKGAIDQLVDLHLARWADDQQTMLLCTDIGQRAAGFSKIARK